MKLKDRRNFIFLKDVFFVSLSAFGGPQAHLLLFLETFVKKHQFITESELIELQSLCQILPGPTSTQTITAIGFRLGGAKLAYLTLLIWILPASIIMILASIGITLVESNHASLKFSQFIQPMAVGFMIYGVFGLGQKLLVSKSAISLFVLATIIAYLFPSPYITPLLIFLGGLFASLKYRRQEKMIKQPIKIQWANFLLWLGVLLFTAILGKITHSLPVRLFENFYRNGSLTFGGGHVLKPLLYTEFVQFKHYLSSEEFLSGLALSEVIPGPVFSFASYIGSLSMREYGIQGQIIGGISATAGIFLPGAFLVFFVIRFWDQLKKYRGIRASLEGVNAVSIGLSAASSLLILRPFWLNSQFLIILVVTVLLLQFTKLPPYLFIIGGLLAGYFFR
jgi:chromate transporter